MSSAIEFSQTLRRFAGMAERREQVLFERIVNHVERSVRYGSPTTGAPGQPVDTGELLRSWYRTGSIQSRVVSLASDLPYAPIIEDNFRGAQLRSKVGGFHSVKLTKHGFKAIIRQELGVTKSKITMSTSGTASGPVFKGGAWRDSAGRFTGRPG